MTPAIATFPPPYWILVPIDGNSGAPVKHGELTPTECQLDFNEDYYTIEEFESKVLWIARLLELGIIYEEGG